MSMLQTYLLRADPEKQRRLRQQHDDANQHCTITCGCGWKRALTMAYRCLYCGEYFCLPCAEKHFGQTIQEWIVEKRIAKSKELEGRP